MSSVEFAKKALMNTYARFDITFVKGEGARLWDDHGREYIDFASGIGVTSIGHAHPDWVRAVSEQAAALAHTSNLYYNEPSALLALRLTTLAGMHRVFFANSGAEANEGAIKLARKYARDKGFQHRYTIATMQGSFHGRTLATLSATGQEKFHQHFMPFVEGFTHVPFNDLDALNALDDSVCAVMVEPVRGEGGVLPQTREYWQGLRALCDERGWLMIADEVQTGIGRTGSWFAYQQLGAMPDIVTFAKGLAGGLPLGGFMTNARCSDTLTPGTHATTFGGNAICSAAALATLDILEPVIPTIADKAQQLNKALQQLPNSGAVKGMGLMLGMQVGDGARDLVERLLRNGLVALTAGDGELRLLPPLTIRNDVLQEGIQRLQKSWHDIQEGTS